ncbi:hypothetical protein DNK65_06945 [Citrobacter koseri]|nr:hypothetical protein DNK65_06945 [Citrobacter koseri]
MDTVPDGASLIRPTACTDPVGRIRRLRRHPAIGIVREAPAATTLLLQSIPTAQRPRRTLLAPDGRP